MRTHERDAHTTLRETASLPLPARPRMGMGAPVALRIIAIGLCIQSLSAQPDARRLDDADIAAQLKAPVIVETRIGRSFEGEAIEVAPARIALLSKAGSGSVEYTFEREEVVDIRLPGDRLKPLALDLLTDDRAAEALNLIDRLFAQRAPFFPYLPEAEAVYFARTVPNYRAHGRAVDGLKRAELLAPVLADNPRMADLLRDELLLGAFLTADLEQARGRANSWIDTQPRFADSALGWYVLGTLEQQDGMLEEALFTFLWPIIFSGALPMPYLEDCYMGAIETAAQMEQWSTAQRLESEMSKRGFVWPADRVPPALPIDASSPNPRPDNHSTKTSP